MYGKKLLQIRQIVNSTAMGGEKPLTFNLLFCNSYYVLMEIGAMRGDFLSPPVIIMFFVMRRHAHDKQEFC